MTHEKANGVTFIDDASFYKPNYNRNDLDTFTEFFREVFPTQETEYNLSLYMDKKEDTTSITQATIEELSKQLGDASPAGDILCTAKCHQ